MKRVDNREFVVAWMNSTSADEVMRATGQTRAGVVAKATALRKRGVRLPRMDRQPKDWQLEVAQLNSLIKKHSK